MAVIEKQSVNYTEDALRIASKFYDSDRVKPENQMSQIQHNWPTNRWSPLQYFIVNLPVVKFFNSAIRMLTLDLPVQYHSPSIEYIAIRQQHCSGFVNDAKLHHCTERATSCRCYVVERLVKYMSKVTQLAICRWHNFQKSIAQQTHAIRICHTQPY